MPRDSAMDTYESGCAPSRLPKSQSQASSTSVQKISRYDWWNELLTSPLSFEFQLHRGEEAEAFLDHYFAPIYEIEQVALEAQREVSTGSFATVRPIQSTR